jgi:hypothetical protein
MKKLTAVIMALCMLFTSVAVFAEDDAEYKAKDNMVANSAERQLNWKDFSSDEEYENLIPKGEFTTFKKIGVKIWMPKMLKPTELSNEEKKAGYIGYFQLEDNEDYAVGVTLTEMSTRCKNAAELLKLLGKVNGISNRKLVVVNGITGVSYDIKEKDTTVLAFLTEKGRCMEFAFSPVSDEDFMPYILLISSSIQNAEVKKKAEKSADSKAEKSTESGDSKTEGQDESTEDSEGEDRGESDGESEEDRDETSDDSEEEYQDESAGDSEGEDQDESNGDSEEGDEGESGEDSEEGDQDETSENPEEGDEDVSYENAVG